MDKFCWVIFCGPFSVHLFTLYNEHRTTVIRLPLGKFGLQTMAMYGQCPVL